MLALTSEPASASVFTSASEVRGSYASQVDLELIDRLRADVIAANYRTSDIAALLGDAADASRQRGVATPARRVLDERGASPLGTLVRVFLLGDAVPTAELGVALPSLTTQGAESLGLVKTIDETVRAALSLNPVTLDSSAGQAEWWIISDLDDQLRRGPAKPDHVMGVGGATRSLIAQAPLAASGASLHRVLDLGTGCGIVALQLAHDTPATVVATDISARALMLARANARLNELADRIDFRLGSLFEPVAGEQFDLILSNPPFVITPRDGSAEQYEYRDGGMTGDDLVARVIAEAPEYLVPGGTLLCLANWECPWGVDGLERVREWVLDAPGRERRLAGWVIERDRVDPAQYAETWARDGGARPGTAEFEALMAGWLDDFASRRVLAIGLGSIRILRLEDAASDDVWHAERAGGTMSADAGDGLQQALVCAAQAERLSDTEMAATHWMLGVGITEERLHQPGEEAPRAISLVTERGIARRITADPLLAAAIGACDGDLSLGQIAGALATLLEVDESAATEALVTGFRELVWMGVLAPA